jgi:phosphate/sulfate permease
VYAPEIVAASILYAARHPRREIPAGRLLSASPPVVASPVQRLTELAKLRRADVVRTERRFRYAQLVSSAAVSSAHGGNNAQKTMGVVAGARRTAPRRSTGRSSVASPSPGW